MKTTSTPKKDMYAQITEEIIAMLESGKKSNITWAQTGNSLPRNQSTRCRHSG